MLKPVRCFTCGKVFTDDMYRKYDACVAKGCDPQKVFKDLGVKRYCCKTILITSIDFSGKIL